MEFFKRSDHANEDSNSEPFYLRVPENSSRKNLAIILILILLSIANPFFIIAFVTYAIYLLRHIKKIKGEESRYLIKAINYYKEKNYEESEHYCLEILKDNKNLKASIILALIYFEKKQYNLFVETLEKFKDSKIDNDIDLLLKLGEAYENINCKEKAIIIYKSLYKSFPNSNYLKTKLDK